MINIYQKVKSFFNKDPSRIGYKLIQDVGNGFYCWNGNLYKSDIVRSCIRPKAKAVGKMVAKHIRNDGSGLKVNPEPYMKMLLEEPNPYMSGQMILEKMINQLELNNNAFAFINRDENGYPMEIYPINATSVEAIYNTEGLLYLRFTLKNGKNITFAYSDIIHLRQDYNENDIFGTSKFDALKPLMEIVTTTDQGIVNAIKNGAVVKWLLKFNMALKPEDLKKATKEFVDNYLAIDNEVGGAAAADGKYEAKQVDPKDYVPNPMLIDKTLQRIYSIFGTNEKIIQSKYTENEWISYFEAEVEPIAVQLSNEYTRKLFSRRERGFGNRIVFEASNLQYASMSTKLALVQMVDRRSLSPNEWRAVFNLAPVEGGDEYIMRLDTETVNSKNDDTLNNKKIKKTKS
ncbi:MAG: phage portal protein [Clostridium sp.]|nr:phage portal protein [Clostridium sp.]